MLCQEESQQNCGNNQDQTNWAINLCTASLWWHEMADWEVNERVPRSIKVM